MILSSELEFEHPSFGRLCQVSNKNCHINNKVLWDWSVTAWPLLSLDTNEISLRNGEYFAVHWQAWGVKERTHGIPLFHSSPLNYASIQSKNHWQQFSLNLRTKSQEKQQKTLLYSTVIRDISINMVQNVINIRGWWQSG